MTLWPSEIYVYSAILLLTVCSVITRAGFMLFGDYARCPTTCGGPCAMRRRPP